MSKLSDFLSKKKIDHRRILTISKKLEALQPEDRAAKLAKKKRSKPEEGAAAPKKPRSGRPVSPPTLHAAIAGQAISGPAKTRITRAVNAVLSQKKQAEVGVRDLF